MYPEKRSNKSTPSDGSISGTPELCGSEAGWGGFWGLSSRLVKGIAFIA
jgi:hypothetical protein